MTNEQVCERIRQLQPHIQFDELLHKYWYDDKPVISVTQLLGKHNISPSYKGAPASVLKQSAERGTIIHKDIEEWINSGKDPQTSEGMLYQDMLLERGLIPLCAEFFVGNEECCGTCDTLLFKDGEFFIDDHKTGQVHENAVRWQCSIYAYLLGIYDIVKGIWCSHLGKDKCEMLYFEKISKEEIEALFERERNGVVNYNTLVAQLDANQQEVVDIQRQIEQFAKSIKQLEAKKKEFTDRILENMRQENIDKIICGNISFTRIKATTRQIIDTKALTRDLPDVAEKYKKTTNVGENLRINIGGTDND